MINILKLKEMTEKYPTRFWNDSCNIKELKSSMEYGATGATTNPVIAKTVLAEDMERYKDFIEKSIKNNPTSNEDDIAWFTLEYMAKEGAKILKPIFDYKTGKGRISIQTNTKNYRNWEKLYEQSIHFNTLAENIQVKMPATKAGIKAFEEATYSGVSINATVCFSIPQAIAAAEAVERGLRRRKDEGKSNENINPVITIMVGRLDDWLKIAIQKEGRLLNPSCLELAGVSVFKKAYKIFKERKYKSMLLGAAYRNRWQVELLIGEEIIHTIPYKWQGYYNASKHMKIENSIEKEVPKEIIEELNTMPDFVKAYNENAMTEEEFEEFAPTRRTLNQFAEAYDELVKIIRSFMIPKP